MPSARERVESLERAWKAGVGVTAQEVAWLIDVTRLAVEWADTPTATEAERLAEHALIAAIDAGEK